MYKSMYIYICIYIHTLVFTACRAFTPVPAPHRCASRVHKGGFCKGGV